MMYDGHVLFSAVVVIYDRRRSELSNAIALLQINNEIDTSPQ